MTEATMVSVPWPVAHGSVSHVGRGVPCGRVEADLCLPVFQMSLAHIRMLLQRKPETSSLWKPPPESW